MNELKQFCKYCWSFYGPDGVFAIDGLTFDQMFSACMFVFIHEPSWCGGDSEDRFTACKVLLGMYPQLRNPYGY